MAKSKQPAETPEPEAPQTTRKRRRPYVEPPTPPAPKAEDYELPDSSFDPEIDMAPSREPVAEKPAEKPRDDSGKFVKKPHPERLVDLARQLNIGEDEIAHSSTAELRASVQEEQMRLLLSQQQDRHRSNIQDAIQSSPPPTPEPEPEPAFPELEETNPALAKFLKQQSSELKQLKALLLQQAQVAAAQSRHQVFDAAFKGLGKDYERFFGAGDGESAGKAEIQRRNAIIAAAGLSERDNRSQIASKIQNAARSVYGAVIAPSETDQEADVDDAPTRNGHSRITPEQWQNAGLPRPSGGRHRELPKGQQRAAHAVADKMREHNIHDEDFDTIEEQNLPD